MTTFSNFDLITADPTVIDGTPCLKGTRITVRRVLEILATNPSWDELREDYPEITEQHLTQALGFAAAHLTDRIIPIPSIEQ